MVYGKQIKEKKKIFGMYQISTISDALPSFQGSKFSSEIFSLQPEELPLAMILAQLC